MAGSVSAARAGSSVIEVNGREYEIRCLTWDHVIVKLEEWLRSRELSALVSSWKVLVDAGLMKQEDVIRNANEFVENSLRTGRHSFGSEIMNRVLGLSVSDISGGGSGLDVAGKIKLVSLLTGLTMEEVTELATSKPEEFGALLSATLMKSLPDPKG